MFVVFVVDCCDDPEEGDIPNNYDNDEWREMKPSKCFQFSCFNISCYENPPPLPRRVRFPSSFCSGGGVLITSNGRVSSQPSHHPPVSATSYKLGLRVI